MTTNGSGLDMLQYNRSGNYLYSVDINFFNIGVLVLWKNKILWLVLVVMCGYIYADTLVAFLTQTLTIFLVYSTFLLSSLV